MADFGRRHDAIRVRNGFVSEAFGFDVFAIISENILHSHFTTIFYQPPLLPTVSPNADYVETIHHRLGADPFSQGGFPSLSCQHTFCFVYLFLLGLTGGDHVGHDRSDVLLAAITTIGGGDQLHALFLEHFQKLSELIWSSRSKTVKSLDEYHVRTLHFEFLQHPLK